ncbi:MAG TPA: YebC/PmpR family DNA-binding transcriptional regulator [Candidatus Xenobia bacterium]|jgi:YebC/PmpR family DNA-binding regulatory protein
MSGHSKWHNIRLKKGKVDAQRGKMFTKISREILMAAKAGGGDPEANLTLKNAIIRAREVNMPADNIKRVIEKATGGAEGANFEEIMYEGYGPHGVAVLVDAATDNRNRTAADMRNLFAKNNGNLGDSGCVAWMFDKKGVISIPGDAITEDKLFELAIDAGAEDVKPTDDGFEVLTAPTDFAKVLGAIEKAKVKTESAELSMIPKTVVILGAPEARAVLKLMDVLEDYDDVIHVYANFDIPAEVLEEVGA